MCRVQREAEWLASAHPVVITIDVANGEGTCVEPSEAVWSTPITAILEVWCCTKSHLKLAFVLDRGLDPPLFGLEFVTHGRKRIRINLTFEGDIVSHTLQTKSIGYSLRERVKPSLHL